MDLIFLGLVVALILYRLNSVLGTRPERPQIKIITKKEFDKIYDMIQNKAHEDEKFGAIKVSQTPFDKELLKIEGFDKNAFLRRASKAFEMILEAFSNRDKETLKMLTTVKLYEQLSNIIDERTTQNITSESDLIRIDEMEIVDVKITMKKAHISVKFQSDQINVLKKADGEVIEGDENFVQQITDVWTFEKDLDSKTHVWLLSSTKKKQ